jgi:hypothetical protein
MEDTSVLDNVRCYIHFLNTSWKAGRPNGAESSWTTLKDAGSHPANSNGPFPEGSRITVCSIAEEYRHIVQERCTCGGVFVSGLQATGSSVSGQFDVINAACVGCGSIRQFKFSLTGTPRGRGEHHNHGR